MSDGDTNGGRAMQGGSVAQPFAPFEFWARWMRENLGGTSMTTGGPPWIEADPDRQPGEIGAKGDPVLVAIEQTWNANPLKEVLPLNWVEITRALQILWSREMADPARAVQTFTEYNAQVFGATMKVWSEAAARFWGVSVGDGEERRDKRFAAEEWESNPYYATLRKTYELASEYLLDETKKLSRDPEEERRLRFHVGQFVDALAPVNFVFSNPAALKRAMETGGASLAEGARNLVADIEEGSLSLTDASAFEVGKDLAATPGKVVMRNKLVELIQYEPTTEKVKETPIVFFPPWINKYYILDLTPQKSMVRHLVEQGYTVFMTSWKNPDESMGDTPFEEYMELGPLAAAEAAREITGAEKVNPVGYCIGGTLLSMTLAYLAGKGGENPFNAPTFMVALQDFSEVGDTAVFIDEPQIEYIERQMLERGYLDKGNLTNMFNLLRSNDLIWNAVVNNYLLGNKPPAFDLLYWNSDGTRMAPEAHSFYLRNTYLENNLVEPGKVVLKGQPLDLGKITGEAYAVGAQKDHIVPWQSAWAIARLTSAKVRFALASSGHIAGMINPPEKGKGKHWINETGDAGDYASAEEWLGNATEQGGSWWSDWTAWLGERSGGEVDPPPLGSETYPPLEDAPGTYVKEK